MSDKIHTQKKIIVTSALPYANGPIHLGHIAGAYLPADIFVRYHRLMGNDIVYICGSDEHGVPITLRAEVEGITPQKVVDKYHEMNKKSFYRLGISFDNFSRTSLPIHYETSQDFFLDIYKKGILKTKTETHLFCSNCNRFLADRFVEGKCPNCGSVGARGDQCENCGTWLNPAKLIEPHCKICGSVPVAKETMHWYIPLSDFQKQLEDWILPKKDWKDNVINFCKGWFEQGLEDRAVTRDLYWGIPVPLEGSEGKVLYVWFDAPIGYISSTKEWAQNQGNPELWKEYWCNPETKLYHFIGKDNIVFHAIFFPVILMAYGGYNLPENVIANEFLTLESRKISTSKNYAVWLNDYLNTFPPDSLRYCLASISPETKDADFSWHDFQSRNNNELADILGNFINRTLVFIDKYFDAKIPEPHNLSQQDIEIVREVENQLDVLANNIETFQIKAGVNTLMDIARKANKYFNDSEPWVTLKHDRVKCASTLYICSQIIKTLALGMSPYLPFTMEKVIHFLDIKEEFETKNWEEIKNTPLLPGKTINKPDILFYKIEDEVIQNEVDKLESIVNKTDDSDKRVQSLKEVNKLEEITIEDFRKLDLRIAEVKSISRVPNTDKLYRLEVDDGDDIRSIITGLADYYEPEELNGKSIVLLANLKPAKIRGEFSNGMLLAAEKDGKLALLTTDNFMEPGSKIT